MTILLCTEGTYPYYGGGVSMWCETLIKGLPDQQFMLYSVTGHVSAKPYTSLPANVTDLIQVPLWGIDQPGQHFLPGKRRKKPDTAQFLPLLETLLYHILYDASIEDAGQVIYSLWLYFQEHDWQRTWEHAAIWKAFSQQLTVYDRALTLGEIANLLHLFQHYLIPLQVPVPDVQVIHNTCAGHSGLVGVIGKLAYRIPFVLTEHGVLIREQYLFIGQEPTLTYKVKNLVVQLNTLLCRLNYHYADLICPVTKFNVRWEKTYGANPRKIRTIYNGIDTDLFKPVPKPASTADRPTVVAATRIMPLKDIETMIRSAAIVRDVIPNVLYLVYGSLDAAPDYVERCRQLIKQLQLEENFILRGHTDSPHEIYQQGDLSVLSSVSEAFPLAVLESMACERPVISTDVGGVAEALEDGGVLVNLNSPMQLAEEIIHLLQNDTLRAELGKRARERVINNFRTEVFLDQYRRLYEQAYAVYHKRQA